MTIKVTRNADQEYVLLLGTESGRIKIYGLADNSRKGIIAAHNKVVGFLAWDGSAFISIGSEGKAHVWLWKSVGPANLGAAVMGTGSGFGGTSSSYIFGGGARPGGGAPIGGMSAHGMGIGGMESGGMGDTGLGGMPRGF